GCKKNAPARGTAADTDAGADPADSECPAAGNVQDTDGPVGDRKRRIGLHEAGGWKNGGLVRLWFQNSARSFHQAGRGSDGHTETYGTARDSRSAQSVQLRGNPARGFSRGLLRFKSWRIFSAASRQYNRGHGASALRDVAAAQQRI